AAVLMMIEAWIGEDKFRAALRAYLEDHRLGNATTDDLAKSLRATSGLDAGSVLHAFLDTGGTPSVHGEVECDKNTHGAASAELRLTQAGGHSIPACWRSDSASGCEVIDSPKTVKLASCPAWAYFNAGGTGYYRTTWLAAALTALRVADLTPAERLTLV